jgi:hypothetical protein
MTPTLNDEKFDEGMTDAEFENPKKFIGKTSK